MLFYSSPVPCSKGAPSLILGRYSEPFPLLSLVALVTAFQPSSLQPEDLGLGSLLLRVLLTLLPPAQPAVYVGSAVCPSLLRIVR